MILSADSREITAKVTVRWSGVTKTEYETDFTVEISKDRVRLTVDRDTAVIQINASNLRQAETDVANTVRPLLPK
jgi:D-serine dehydratase